MKFNKLNFNCFTQNLKLGEGGKIITSLKEANDNV